VAGLALSWGIEACCHDAVRDTTSRAGFTRCALAAAWTAFLTALR
jgi:hypothetical protein